MAKTYREKLLDPRWQKRRLEIMELRGWACWNCGATDKTLHVHHTTYLRGMEPWDYHDNHLLALCDDCHAHEENLLDELRQWLGEISGDDISEVIGYICGMLCRNGRMTGRPSNHPEAVGMAAATGLPTDTLTRFLMRNEGTPVSKEMLRYIKDGVV